MQIIILKKDEERRIRAGHLWIYSNEIDTRHSPLKNYTPGELVRVLTANQKFLGIGSINPENLLTVRLFTTIDEDIDIHFFTKRIKNAWLLRKQLFSKPYYRLVYAESDLLSGLIIDRFNDIFIVQANTIGIANCITMIVEVLIQLFEPSGIYVYYPQKNTERMTQENKVIYGHIPEEITVNENDLLFKVPSYIGQKTGWYYDQRENRQQLQHLVANKRVLDAFSYTGAFAIYAAHYGAKEIACLDSSKLALEYVKHNAELNNHQNKISILQGDALEVMQDLAQQKQKFAVVLIDPPAFIKKRKDISVGTAAYQKINSAAMNLLTDDGILVTSSCSMHLTHQMLVDVVRRSALKTQNFLQIFHQGFQAADHPIHPAIPETAYLKTLFCYKR